MEKNDFKISKNLARYRSEDNFCWIIKISITVRSSSISKDAKNFDILTTNLSILHII